MPTGKIPTNGTNCLTGIEEAEQEGIGLDVEKKEKTGNWMRAEKDLRRENEKRQIQFPPYPWTSVDTEDAVKAI